MTNETEKHNNTKITISMRDMSYLWYDLSDNVRMEMVKSIIWTAPDSHTFYGKLMWCLNSEKFQSSID